MRIDIIEVETKKSIRRIIIIFLITLFLIAVFSMLGIYFAKSYKVNYIKNNKKLNNSVVTVQNVSKENKKEEVVKESIEDKNVTDKQDKKIDIKDIYNKDTKIAYLTFDDGPSAAVTPLILDVLKEENIKATFFVLGTNIKNNPDILKRAYQEGHYIANHGYSHDYKKIYKDAKNVMEEYEKTEKLIKETIGNAQYSSNLFRFPGGYKGGKYEKIKIEAGKILNDNNIFYIDWNVLTGDAEGANTKEKILKNVEKNLKDNGNIVVLMHDSSSKILTYETLKDVIKYLRDQGYTFDNFYSIIQ